MPDFIELLTHVHYPSPVYKGYGAMIAEQRFSPVGFRLSLGLKEVRLALSAVKPTTFRCLLEACCAIA